MQVPEYGMGFQITGNCEYSSAGLGSSWYISSITLINKLENIMARTLGPGNQLRNIIQRKQISRAWSIKKNHEPTGRSFALPLRSIQKIIPHLNSSWPSATYMRRDFQCLFPQRLRYVALISVLISPVPHTWGVTNGSLLASPPNSRRSPASLISPAPHICGASRTPILTRVVWKILNVVTNILVVLPDYRLP